MTAYTYDSAGQLVQANTTEAGQSPLTFGISYNLLGEITNLSQAYPAVGGNINNSGAWAYSYTPAGELSTAQFTPTGGSSGPLTTYGYDGSGNRISATVGSTTTNDTYDGAGRLASVGSTSYTWNNQDQLTNVGSGTTYGYDVWGRLSSASVGSSSVSYSYDALSRTLSRAVSGGSTTSYTYSGTGQNPTSQTVGAGSPTYYAWGASGPLAQKSGSATRFYAQDPHGDLAAVFDTAGVATGTLSYDPWGTPTAVGTDATASLLGYQSQPTDPTTGLVDMGARLYDPSEARFTTQDTLLGSPTNPLTLNQYVYAGDSPLDNSDPSGNSFACAGQQCTAKQTVKYHAIQAYYEAENRGQPGQAAAYLAQAVTWLAQAAATPAPSAKAPPVVPAHALPTGWTYRSDANGPGVHGSGNYCVAAARTVPSCFSQPEVPSSSWQEQAIGGLNILALALTPFTDGASDDAALSLDAILDEHVAAAVDRLGVEGLTQRQALRVADNPGLEAAFRGERIDTFAKESAAADPRLAGIEITGRFQRGPDFLDSKSGAWWDITTQAQWPAHVVRYGPGGTLLPY